MKIIEYEYSDKVLEKYLELKDKYLPKFKEENELNDYFNVSEDVHLYGIWENRPFFRLLYNIASLEASEKKYLEAYNDFKFILKINPNDNQGVRDDVAILAYELGDEKEVNLLSQKYPGESAIEFSKACFALERDKSYNKFIKKLFNINKFKSFFIK